MINILVGQIKGSYRTTNIIERGIGHIIINKVDTITDPRFYSNSAARTKVLKKVRNYVGTFYK